MAGQTLSDFLATRFNQLEHEADTLRTRLAEIDAERAQLAKAAMAAGLSAPAAAQTSPIEAESSGATMKEAVLAVLKAKGRGMTAVELLPLVNAYCGREFQRSSLSPQLSRLRVEEKIDRVGLVWRLKEDGIGRTAKAVIPPSLGAPYNEIEGDGNSTVKQDPSPSEFNQQQDREAGPGGGT